VLTIDGINLELVYNVGVYPSSDDPLMPEVRNNFVDRASFGSIDYRSSYGSFPFTLACFIQGGDIRQKLKEIIALFVDDDGEFKQVKVSYSPWGDVYREAKLTKQVTLSYEEEGTNFGEFSLDLNAADPFGRSNYQIEKYYGDVNLMNASLEIPITYYGTYKAGFNFTFFGSLSYFDVEVHAADGSTKVFHYVSPLHETYFRCDFTDFVIDDNGNNGLDDSTGDFLFINRATTKIVFRGNMTGSMNFSYRELYSTV
jgi:Phage tail protein